MTRLFQAATVAAVGLTALTAITVDTAGMAQTRPGDAALTPAGPAAQPASFVPPSLPAAPTGSAAAAADADAAGDGALAIPVPAVLPAQPDHARPVSLAAAMARAEGQPAASEDDRCLAAGVYFEAKGEPLEGQLAVAHVILARAQSGRFASSACGVLTQRGQFSFVRGGTVPTPPQGREWRTAQAIARVARDGGWRNPAPGAMYFHAARVAPGWNRVRVTRLGNHVFYR